MGRDPHGNCPHDAQGEPKGNLPETPVSVVVQLAQPGDRRGRGLDAGCQSHRHGKGQDDGDERGVARVLTPVPDGRAGT